MINQMKLLEKFESGKAAYKYYTLDGISDVSLII